MLMKYTDSELRAALHKEIAAVLARRQPVHPAWITHTLCKRHREGLAFQDGDDVSIRRPGEAIATPDGGCPCR